MARLPLLPLVGTEEVVGMHGADAEVGRIVGGIRSSEEEAGTATSVAEGATGGNWILISLVTSALSLYTLTWAMLAKLKIPFFILEL